jgi:hypothetical protein
MTTMQDAVKRLTYEFTSTGEDKVAGALKAVNDGQAAVAVTSQRASQATLVFDNSLAQVEKRYGAVIQQQLNYQHIQLQTMQQTQSAANDNVRAIGQFADAADKVGTGLVSVAESTLSLIGHLKLLALAAYAMSPAFRGVVNLAMPAVLQAIGVTASVATSALGGVASKALGFFSSIGPPIAAVVIAWQGLNYVISQGISLLDKYGSVDAQRKLYAPSADADLEKLTKFQSDSISADQVQYATDLGTRLAAAKQTINEFLTTQIDVTNAALKLQNVWVIIVETVARAASQVSALMSYIPSWVPKIAAFLPGIGAPVQAYNYLSSAPPAAASQGDAMAAARQRLAGGMGNSFAGRFQGDVSALADQSKATDTATAAATQVRDAWDRAVTSLERHTLTLQADTMTLGQSAGAAAGLRAEFQLLEAAKVVDSSITDDQIASYVKLRATMSAHDAQVQSGLVLNDNAQKQFDRVTQSIRDQTAAYEKAKLANDIKFQFSTVGLSDQDLRIAQQLRGVYDSVPDSLKSWEAEQLRVIDNMKLMKDLADDALKGFLSDLRSGKSPLDAFTNSLLRMSDKITDMALNKLVAAGGAAIFGGTGANDNLSQSVAAGIKSANQQAADEWRRSASTPGGGAPLSLAAPGAAAGPNYALGGIAAVGAGVGAYQGGQASASPGQGALSGALSGGLSGAAIGTMILPGVGTLIGAGVGALAGAGLGFLGGKSGQDAAQQQARDQAIAAAEARDAANQLSTLTAALDTNTKSGALAAFDANANAQRLQEAKDGGAAMVSLENSLSAQRLALVKQFTDRAVAQQQAAEQVLSGVTKTDIQTRLDNISDAAKSLTSALTDLGLSTDGVVGKVSDAIIKLRQSFEQDLQGKINSAQGKGYLNDISSLIATNQSNVTDAASIGADPNLVAKFFQVQAQSIVDNAQLTGQAFQDLINQFPTLTGVVNQFVTTVSASTLAADAQGWTDSLFAALNDTTTLAGQLAAFDYDANKQRLAEAQQGNQNIILMETSLAAQRLKIITTFNQQVMASQDSLATSITAFLANLKGGSNSVLSPQDRLGSAQTAFNSQLSLAQGGDFNAANSITSYAQTLLDASKAYYGSAAGNQTIVAQVTAALQALPAQTTLADLIKAQTTAINTQGSIQTSALGVQTFAINTKGDSTVGAIGGTTGAVNDNQSVLNFIKSATDISNQNLASVATLQSAANTLQDTANATASSSYAQLVTMSAILNTANANLSQMVQQNVTSLASLSFLQSINSRIDTSNAFLTRIATNTKLMAGGGGVATGGWITGPGTGTSDSVFGVRLSNGEAVIPAANAAINRQTVDALIAGRPLPSNVIPFPVGGAGGMGEVLNELRSLRAEVSTLRQEQKSGLGQVQQATVMGAAHVGERVDIVAGAQRDLVRETAHAGRRKAS